MYSGEERWPSDHPGADASRVAPNNCSLAEFTLHHITARPSTLQTFWWDSRIPLKQLTVPSLKAYWLLQGSFLRGSLRQSVFSSAFLPKEGYTHGWLADCSPDLPLGSALWGSVAISQQQSQGCSCCDRPQPSLSLARWRPFSQALHQHGLPGSGPPPRSHPAGHSPREELPWGGGRCGGVCESNILVS